MKKLLMLILCLGMTFAVGACGLLESGTSSNSQPESLESVDNSGDASDDSSDNSSDDSSDDSSDNSSDDSSGDSSDDSSDDSSGDGSSATPPIIDGENEMPLVPIG